MAVVWFQTRQIRFWSRFNFRARPVSGRSSWRARSPRSCARRGLVVAGCWQVAATLPRSLGIAAAAVASQLTALPRHHAMFHHCRRVALRPACCTLASRCAFLAARARTASRQPSLPCCPRSLLLHSQDAQHLCTVSSWGCRRLVLWRAADRITVVAGYFMAVPCRLRHRCLYDAAPDRSFRSLSGRVRTSLAATYPLPPPTYRQSRHCEFI